MIFQRPQVRVEALTSRNVDKKSSHAAEVTGQRNFQFLKENQLYGHASHNRIVLLRPKLTLISKLGRKIQKLVIKSQSRSPQALKNKTVVFKMDDCTKKQQKSEFEKILSPKLGFSLLTINKQTNANTNISLVSVIYKQD